MGVRVFAFAMSVARVVVPTASLAGMVVTRVAAIVTVVTASGILFGRGFLLDARLRAQSES